MAQKIVGLDIGSYSIKAAVLETSFRGWELVGFESMRIAPSEYVQAEKLIEDIQMVDAQEELEEATSAEEQTGEEVEQESEEIIEEASSQRLSGLQESIRKMLGRYGQEWETLYTAFDGDAISLKMIEVPFSDHRMIESTLAHTLEDHLPFSLEKKVFDYGVLSHEENATRLLVGILDHDIMASYLDAFKASGKEPKGVTVDGAALGHLYEQLIDEEAGGVHALLDIGHRKTTVCILHNKRVDFVRTIPIGGQNLTRALKEDLGVSFDEAERLKHYKGFLPCSGTEDSTGDEARISNSLAEGIQPLLKELRLTFQAYVASTKRKCEVFKLIGGTSKLGNICEFLSEEFDVPVERFSYLKPDFSQLADGDSVEPVMASSLGLALASISGNRKDQMNFRKGEFAFKGDFEFWKGRLIHVALSILVILLFFTVNIWSQFQVMGSERDFIEQQIQTACKQTLKADVSDAKICISRMMETVNKSGTGGGLMPSTSMLTIYDELVARIGMIESGVDLKDLSITQKKIKLKGEVDSIPTVGILVENLKTFDECFRSVNQGPTRSNVRGDKIEFSIDIVVDCEEGAKAASKKKKKKAAEAPKTGQEIPAAADTTTPATEKEAGK